MNIAFGLSLLMITLQFQFGHTIIETPNVIVDLKYGYITEPILAVRIIEGLISLGLVWLGIKGTRRVNKIAKRRTSINS